MKLHEPLTARCYDGVPRTGKIIYIHPDHIFATLEFEGLLGNWRESIMLRRRELEINEKEHKKPAPFTPAEDRLILESQNVAKTASQLGRTERACYGRRSYLKKLRRQGA